MKRNLDLVRSILLRCEDAAPGEFIDLGGLKLDDAPRVIAEHVAIMSEAGLIESENMGSHDGTDFIIKRITWAGHDFLSASRDSALWKRFLVATKDKATGFTIDLAVAWLKHEAAKQLGIQMP